MLQFFLLSWAEAKYRIACLLTLASCNSNSCIRPLPLLEIQINVKVNNWMCNPHFPVYVAGYCMIQLYGRTFDSSDSTTTSRTTPPPPLPGMALPAELRPRSVHTVYISDTWLWRQVFAEGTSLVVLGAVSSGGEVGGWMGGRVSRSGCFWRRPPRGAGGWGGGVLIFPLLTLPCGSRFDHHWPGKPLSRLHSSEGGGVGVWGTIKCCHRWW